MKWFLLVFAGMTGVVSGDIIDTLVFGNLQSERQHQFQSGRSEVLSGGLGESARRLLAPETESWEGGRMTFTMAVPSAGITYVTLRLWGSETNQNRLILYCEEKQIGYLQLGDIDILDLGAESPACRGRFYYTTHPLPASVTRGKTHITCEIRSHGPIWRYGGPFEQYQKNMTEPSRGLYKFYTHTEGCFVPPGEEKQGEHPAPIPVRQSPGPEMIDAVKKRVNQELDRMLASKSPVSQMQMQFAAQAYYVTWTRAYSNSKIVDLVVQGADKLYADFKQNPQVAQAGPGSYNPDWFGLGPVGDSIRLLPKELSPYLDKKLADGTLRRKGWSEMLCASRDWHRRHRRLYTNQSQINDLYGIYLSNRGIQVVDPDKAMPETKVLRYLYESVGLQPWRGSDQDDPVTDKGDLRIGPEYWQLTPKGLTRELGYVGGYGEVLDWMTTMYNATRPGPEQPGDPLIKAQLDKMICSRAVFRYPSLDADGYRVMRLETVIGWRDMHYPGEVCYGQRASWDGCALYTAAVTLTPQAVGYAQQMFSDNQFFESLRSMLAEGGFRITAGFLGVPDQYETLKAQSQNAYRLPMSSGQPDFVFSDEQNGVVAIKNGTDILYASLYWRAYKAINNLAKVHYITPCMERLATVREEIDFAPSGMSYTRKDQIDYGFSNGGHTYPGNLHSAHAGEILPIAKIPDGIPFRPGDESVFAGKGAFYTLRYGSYWIGMNCTANQSYRAAVPDDFKQSVELVSGKKVDSGKSIPVPPQSTVVLYRGEQ